MATFRLADIVQALGGELCGDPALEVRGLAALGFAGPQDLTFLSDAKHQRLLAQSQAACVVVAPAWRQAALARGACIVTDQPHAYFARVTQLWKKTIPWPWPDRIHASAVIDPRASVHPRALIGPLCVLEKGARIGADTVLKSRVTVGADCSLGERCLVHPGVVIGADGFGFAQSDGRWEKVEQLGAVRIGNDVEIGANTCIDRGALHDTVVADGVKLDNLVQIGHNVKLGAHTALAGCVGVAGSAHIGARCTVGGGAVVLGHLSLADDVHISAASVVSDSISQPGRYSGVFPIGSHTDWQKTAATLRQLNRLRERVRALETQLKAQEKS